MANTLLEDLINFEELKEVPIKNFIERDLSGISIEGKEVSNIIKLILEAGRPYDDHLLIVVSRNGNKQYDGVITARTLLGGILKTLTNGKCMLDTDVSSIISSYKPISPDSNVYHALGKFKETEQEVLPVTEEGVYQGLVSKERLLSRLLLAKPYILGAREIISGAGKKLENSSIIGLAEFLALGIFSYDTVGECEFFKPPKNLP